MLLPLMMDGYNVNLNSTIYYDIILSNISNLTNVDIIEQGRPHQVSTGLLVLLAFLYGSISLVAVLGNAMVIFVIFRNKKMQSITNIFIANLAFADVIIGVFSIPFQFQAALLQRWVVPYFLCPLAPFIKNLSVCVSVFTLTIISIDRYIAVMHPLKAGIQMKVAVWILVNIWLFGIFSSLPNLIFFKVILIPDEPFFHQMKPFCSHAYPSELFRSLHIYFLFIVQYALPLVVINITYFRIVYRVWGTKTPGQALDRQEIIRTRNRKKVVKMLIIVVCLFVLSWLPLHIYQVSSQIEPDINKYENIHIIWFCSNWLAMSNSCYNPFVYGLFNSKFKREYQKLLPYCSYCKRQDQDLADYSDESAGSIRRSQLVRTHISSLKTGSYQQTAQNRRIVSFKRPSTNTTEL